MSKIQAIAIKNRPRVPMQPIDSATITVASGILGDFRGAQLGRQITILSEDTWNKVCTRRSKPRKERRSSRKTRPWLRSPSRITSGFIPSWPA